MEFNVQLTKFLETLASWDTILQVAMLITLYLGADAQIVSFVEWVKTRFSLADNAAEILVISVAVVVSGAVLIGEGIIIPETLTLPNFAALVTTVTYAAHKRYLRLKQKDVELDVAEVQSDVYSLAVDVVNIDKDNHLTTAS